MADSSDLIGPVPLERSHERTEFRSGSPTLDEFLARYALQNQRKHASRTYVLLRGLRVVAYYTLAFGSISPEDAPRALAAGLGRYPVPILLLARLAVDETEQARGVGRWLIRDALLRAVQASSIAGLRAIVVDAKDEAATRYYVRLGFTPFSENERRLWMLLDVAQEALDTSTESS